MPTYKFRVLVDSDKEQDVFRDIRIDSAENFEIFYRAIITSFEFMGDQLASFYVSNDDWDKGHEIALMDMDFGTDLDTPFLMRDTPLATIARAEGQKLILVYDFLKMWCFLIELIEISPESLSEPELVFSIGESPEENSKEVEFDAALGMGNAPELGNEIDDIFSEFDDPDDFGSFENIDDFDF